MFAQNHCKENKVWLDELTSETGLLAVVIKQAEKLEWHIFPEVFKHPDTDQYEYIRSYYVLLLFTTVNTSSMVREYIDEEYREVGPQN